MILNRQGLADAMGVRAPTIDAWLRDGCPCEVRGRKGVPAQFSLPAVMAWWAAREREKASLSGDKADENELRRRALVATTGRAELEFARAKGEVAPVAEFERATSKLLAAIRANVMNVPARAVLQLLGETDETTFKAKLRAELVLALEQSSAADVDLDDDDADDDAEGADDED